LFIYTVQTTLCVARLIVKLRPRRQPGRRAGFTSGTGLSWPSCRIRPLGSLFFPDLDAMGDSWSISPPNHSPPKICSGRISHVPGNRPPRSRWTFWLQLRPNRAAAERFFRGCCFGCQLSPRSSELRQGLWSATSSHVCF